MAHCYVGLHPEIDVLSLDSFTWSIQEIAQNYDIQVSDWQMPPWLIGHLSHEQMLSEYINHLLLHKYTHYMFVNSNNDIFT